MDFEVGFEWEEYWVEAKCKFVTDKHYGADADGNRGIERTFMEDFDIHVWESDTRETKGVEIPYEKVSKEDRLEIEKYATKLLEQEAIEYDQGDDS